MQNNPPPLDAQLGQRLGIVAQLYTGLIDRLLEPHGLTWPQFALLAHIARQSGPSRVSDMAAVLDLTQSAATKIVQKFAGLGLVAITRDKTDARNRPVSLTPAGRDRLTTVQRSFAPAFQRLTADWTPDDLHRILTDLEALSSRLEQVRDTARPPSPSPRA
ncbi:MAG: winged helix-turn-helix transcriptional regulator [Rhodobacter sp.]|nr:winged helix-turn-helix transcriptional regulator [Paracoccaceae bacterium]MCC0079919.1 winged helix-turn-helix transcriptional regulator [Rhodobacter sp.]